MSWNWFARRHPPAGSRPLRVMFVLTFMPVGGAETLLVNLVRQMDRRRFAPEICCLKYLGPLGETLAAEMPAFSGFLSHKYDLRVLPRLVRLFRSRQVDAVVTVGTGGDKMFWGRLAAWLAGAKVIASALHSTGLPDRVERSNRALTHLTDWFIAVAPAHGRYLSAHEGCPHDKVRVIPNGVDCERFQPLAADRGRLASSNLPKDATLVAIVAALRPEKDHELFLRVAARVRRERPDARFLVIGDGPRRAALETYAAEQGVTDVVRFLGTRGDVPELLALVDVLLLTSKMEANPVSLLEALVCARAVVAPAVGSIPDVIEDGVHGFLVPAGDEEAFAQRTLELLANRPLARRLGSAGRERVVREGSLNAMVDGYERMIWETYRAKCGGEPLPPRTAARTIENADVASSTSAGVLPISLPIPIDAPTVTLE